MSYYTTFYLGKKDSEGLMTLVGPYEYNIKKKEYELCSLGWRSGSFIDWNDFSNMFNNLQANEIAEKDLEVLTDVIETGYRASYAEYCPFDTFVHNIGDWGLRQAYVEREDFKYIKANDYSIEYDYEIPAVSPEEYAEIQDIDERKKYMKVAYYVICSKEYIIKEIAAAANAVIGYKNENDYYIVVTRG